MSIKIKNGIAKVATPFNKSILRFGGKPQLLLLFFLFALCLDNALYRFNAVN